MPDVGGTLLILAAVIAFCLSPRRPWSVAIPLYGATGTVGGYPLRYALEVSAVGSMISIGRRKISRMERLPVRQETSASNPMFRS